MPRPLSLLWPLLAASPSCMVDRDGWPDCLIATAQSEDGVVQGLRHRDWPIFGVQFHPESIATEHGHTLLRNFLQTTVH